MAFYRIDVVIEVEDEYASDFDAEDIVDYLKAQYQVVPDPESSVYEVRL